MPGLPEDNLSNPFASPGVAPTGEPLAAAGGFPLRQYTAVRTGLQMIYYSMATIAGIFILMLVAGFMLGGMGFGEVFLAPGLLCAVAMLLMVVGFCMTIASPRSDEKSLAIISVVCFFLAIGGSFFGNLFARSFGGAEVIISLGSNILSVASAIVFCLLLKRIGRNIASSRLEKSARSMLVWYGIFFVVCVVGGAAMMWFAFTSIGPGPNGGAAQDMRIAAIFGIALLVIALITLFKYLAMLRTAIDELKPRQVLS